MSLLLVIFAAAGLVLLYYAFTGKPPVQVITTALRRNQEK